MEQPNISNMEQPASNLNAEPKSKSGSIKKRGSKKEVYEGLALQTGGGLRKADLIINKRGQIVSKKRSEQGAKQFKNIEKYIKDRKKKEPEPEEGGKLPEPAEPPQEQAKELPKPVELKPEAVQEEKSAEIPPIKPPMVKARRARKIKDVPPAIEEIKADLNK